MDLLVLAKEPVPGRVKTRFCPPCSPAEAAGLAEAALADTLDAAVSCGAERVLLVLEGRPGTWCPPGVVVKPQAAGSLDARLAHAWTLTVGPALQIGMDTPQVSAGDLDAAFATLARPEVAAVLGPAEDGGWWAVGMCRARPEAFLGVATSRPDTGARQHRRLVELGLHTELLDCHRDVDTWRDATAVAASCRSGRFAAAVSAVSARVAECAPS